MWFHVRITKASYLLSQQKTKSRLGAKPSGLVPPFSNADPIPARGSAAAPIQSARAWHPQPFSAWGRRIDIRLSPRNFWVSFAETVGHEVTAERKRRMPPPIAFLQKNCSRRDEIHVSLTSLSDSLERVGTVSSRASLVDLAFADAPGRVQSCGL